MRVLCFHEEKVKTSGGRGWNTLFKGAYIIKERLTALEIHFGSHKEAIRSRKALFNMAHGECIITGLIRFSTSLGERFQSLLTVHG